MRIQWNKELYHYGMPRRSGRYKWGSGKNPYQGDGSGHGNKKMAIKEQKIARKMDKRIAMNTKYMNEQIDAITKNYNKRGKNKTDLQREKEYWRTGFEETNKLYSRYKDMKIRAIKDKDVKKTKEYRRLHLEYMDIRLGEISNFSTPIVKKAVALRKAQANSDMKLGRQRKLIYGYKEQKK